MSNLWDKVKQTLEQSAKTIKETTETTAKSVAETASKVATNVAEKSKDIAVTIGDKTQEVVSVGQLKIKHYNLSRDVSHKFNELGARTFEIIKDQGKNIYNDELVKNLLDEVGNLEFEINRLESEMDDLKSKQPEQETTESPKSDIDKETT